MSLCGQRPLLPVVFAVFIALLSLLPVAAHADVYQVYNAGTSAGDAQFLLLGLTANGTLVEQFYNREAPTATDGLNCPGAIPSCYFSLPARSFLGSDVNTNALPCASVAPYLCNPGIAFDNGSPCTVSVPSDPNGPNPHQASGICNNGHQVPLDEGIYLNHNTHELYYGPVGFAGPLDSYGAANATLFVNSEGDFAYGYYNGNYVQNYLFIDETSRLAATPEPSSLLLLGTGLATAAGLLRRNRPAVRSKGSPRSLTEILLTDPPLQPTPATRFPPCHFAFALFCRSSSLPLRF